MKKWIINNFTQPMRYRYIVWKKNVRIFTDGGGPIFRWFPRFHKCHYDKHWNMCGFRVYWLGREFWFSFKEDKRGLYNDTKCRHESRKDRSLVKGWVDNN